MVKMKHKRIIFIIALIIYFIYTIFLYQTDTSGFMDMGLFLFVIGSGFYLAEDFKKYKTESSSKKLIWFTLIYALVFAVLSIVLHFPAAEAKDILIEAIARGLIISIVVYVISNIRMRESLN